ncbi:MAG TPA: hypothetical protein RMH99_01270 [Sandaracinaceae bacterium LLY-WYZ-13_1]|nr:hypothetical protein [Sandaracinaceae bacterium LLY-WYZ-13_1]
MRCAVGLAVWAFVLIAAPRSSSAQCESEPEPREEVRALARQRYAEGVEASRAERWDAAREAFRQALEIAPFTPILYNLAGSQEQTGRLIQAAENYRRFLRRCQSRRTPNLRRDAEQLLSSIEERLARVTLQIEGLDPATDEVFLDDRPLVSAVLGNALPVNPGPHEVRVMRRGEGRVAAGGFHVPEGGEHVLELTVGAEGDGPAPGGAEPGLGATGAGGFDPTPAWVVFGASLGVAAAGGVLLAVGQVEASEVEGQPDGTPWTPELQSQADRADLLRNLGWVTMSVGLAGAAVGMVWALVGGPGDEDGEGEATLRVGPGSVSVRGSF